MDRFEYTKNRISDGASLRQIAKELGVGESTVFTGSRIILQLVQEQYQHLKKIS